ncbi:PREDICTED: uncharacterized protein At2g29880-like [Erythranthe guttata]|uniref:uncharacterized protein At2g29880-like n=1 Tax=Erythranthe guttata TaxID=4155 RepID=UPI00064DAEFF|nr:PREDICTED: uncharacterized protein At2g29880-like [Erythranthe guttata]|eukprot:XP_012842525.1 PREDICTED: uncharacterized protein At2g29880-like [Erythranthe guttata]
MDTQTQDTRGRGKNKRKWKYEEDAKLVQVLLDMVNLRLYKAENGFKPGYLNYVEEKMQAFLPNSGLKAKPHIESRIKTLKKDLHIVYDMLHGSNTSGPGFDPIKKCLTGEKAVWDSYLQSHPSHAIWQNKSFPYYEDLVVIFGKDRATGINAEGPADMMENIEREETNNADTVNDVDSTMEPELEDFGAYSSLSPMQSPRSQGTHNQRKKKRSRSSENVAIMTDIKDAAAVIGSEIAKASQIFGKAIGVDAEISEKRQKIDSEIRNISNLTVGEIIKAVCHIAHSHELTDVFFSMTEEGKEQLVKAILNGDV